MRAWILAEWAVWVFPAENQFNQFNLSANDLQRAKLNLLGAFANSHMHKMTVFGRLFQSSLDHWFGFDAVRAPALASRLLLTAAEQHMNRLSRTFQTFDQLGEFFVTSNVMLFNHFGSGKLRCLTKLTKSASKYSEFGCQRLERSIDNELIEVEDNVYRSYADKIEEPIINESRGVNYNKNCLLENDYRIE